MTHETLRTLGVYLAAPFAARDQVRAYATRLPHHDMTSTASWLKTVHEINAGTIGAAVAVDDTTVTAEATTCLRDVERSDALIVLTPAWLGLDPAVSHSGGRHIETGYAIAKRIPVVILGEPENVFHRGMAVATVHTWVDAVAAVHRWWK